MTQREKLLAIGVGSLLLIICAFYAANQVTRAFATRSQKTRTLKGAIAKQVSTISLGKQDRILFERLLDKSLPSDRTFAQNEYKMWLLNLADSEIGLQRVIVSPKLARERGELYVEYPYSINGSGTLEQVVDFLYAFYRADYLHRITSITMNPEKDSNTLKLSIGIQALGLEEAAARRSFENPPASRLAETDIEPYRAAIVRRNPFAAANKPPKFASLGKQNGHRGREISFVAKASDPDAGDKVTYELTGDGLPGARINSNSGLFRWTPKENGSYEITLRATDSRQPGLTDDVTVAIAVTDPPKRVAAAEFDPATLAKVTGITESGSEPELWISVPTEGRSLILRRGDSLEVGTIKGVVDEIKIPRARIKTPSGQILELHLGKPLVQEAAGG